MSDRFELGPRRFFSKGTAREYVRELMRSQEIGAPITDPEGVAVLNALLRRKLDAREKIGGGIANYLVREARETESDATLVDRRLVIRHVDPSEPDADFDYKDYIDGDAQVQLIHDALRGESEKLEAAWKSSRFASGAHAYDQRDEPISDPAEAEVCYGFPSWEELVYEFAQSEGGWEAIMTTTDVGSPDLGRRLTDEEARERWIAFWWERGEPTLCKKD